MKRLKLTGSLLVAAGFLAGCGGNNEGAASPDWGLSDITFPLEERVSLQVLRPISPLAPEDPNEMLIFQRLEEQTGVHIEWTALYGGAFTERRNLAVASGDLPDLIWNAGFGAHELQRMGNDGTIIPLEDIIDSYMPNLSRVLETNPEYRAMMTNEDGHIWAFPWIEELGHGRESIHSVAGLPWINVEWLDNLGLEMPTTIDELREVLIAFRDQDPTGTGQSIVPMSFIMDGGSNDMNFLFGSFGLGHNPDWTVVTNDREVRFTGAEEGFKEAVLFMHELFSEGLIDIEAFDQDWNRYVARGSQHLFGLYFTWDKGNISGMNDSYALMPPLAGPNGERNVTRTNGFGFDRSRIVIPSTNQNIELTARWVDLMFDPHQSVQNNWGTFGDETQGNIFEFDTASNMLRHLPLDGAAPVELRERTAVGGALAILDRYYGVYTTMPDDAAWRLNLLHEYMVPYMRADYNFPPVLFTIEELNRLSDVEANLFPFATRMRAEWIKNGGIEEGWDDYLRELDRLGLQDWLEVRQVAFERYMSIQEQ